MKLSEVLKQARALIATPQGWTWNTNARRGFKSTDVFDEHADQFCAVGALQRVIGREKFLSGKDSEYYDACRLLAAHSGFKSLSDLEAHAAVFTSNDSTSHNVLMRAFDAAILRAELDEGVPVMEAPPAEVVERELALV